MSVGLSVATLVSYLVAVVGTAVSTYFDLKTTYIPDEITHTMMLLGAILLFFQFDVITALMYLGIGLIVFLVGFVIYTLGQIGGGDVKLYTALALLVPTFHPLVNVPTPPYPPIISIFFTSAILGVFFISLKYSISIIKDRSKIEGFRKKLLLGLVAALSVLSLCAIILPVVPGMAFILVPVAVGVFIYPFKDDIMSLYAVVEKPVAHLTEDDIIAIDGIPEKQFNAMGLSFRRTYLSFELSRIKEKAKKQGIRTVPVYENLPTFGVYIFLALITTLIVGDLVFFLLSYV